MKISLYTLLLISLMMMVSFVHVAPKIIDERNEVVSIFVTFKEKVDPKIQEKYGEKKAKKAFINTNNRLKNSNKIFLITRKKYVNRIKFNYHVSSVSYNRDDLINKEERSNLSHFLGVIDDYYIPPIWSFAFHVTSFLWIVNMLTIIGILIKRKIKISSH